VRCAVSAVPDFNRDGRQEIEVSLQQGAAEEQRAVYGVVRGQLRRLPGRPGGRRFSFSYGGSLTYGAYVLCRTRARSHLVLAVAWGLPDDAHASMQVTTYNFDGLRFRLTGKRKATVARRSVPPRVAGRTC
jgi:hypothetical protein